MRGHARMIPVTNGFWTIFGSFEPDFLPGVQEISKDNHISLRNS